jgi:hypothetical protein
VVQDASHLWLLKQTFCILNFGFNSPHVSFFYLFFIPLPEPGQPREKVRALTEAPVLSYESKKGGKFASTLRLTEKGEGPGAAFLSPFLFAAEKKGVGVRGRSPRFSVYFSTLFLQIKTVFPFQKISLGKPLKYVLNIF